MKNKFPHFLFVLSLAFLLFVIRPWEKPAMALEAAWSISAPASVALPAVSWSLDEQQTEITFSEPIVISSDQATLEGFGAQVTSGEFLREIPPLFMGYTNLEIKTGTVSTSQPDGITTPINGTYTLFTGVLSESDPVTFMSADARARSVGTWSITPTIKLTIPAKQMSGDYSTILTFSLF